jgi:ABC-type bacteriocin/lantibiotic exporter with double-glycine peptidase domain
MNNLKFLYSLLDESFKKKYFFLLVLCILYSLLEVLSTSLFLPLIQILEKKNIDYYIFLDKIISTIRLESTFKSKLVLISAIIIIVNSLKLFSSLYLSFFKNKLVFKFQKYLQEKLFFAFTKQSFSNYSSISNSSFVQLLFHESGQIKTSLEATILVLSELFTVSFLIILSFIFNPFFTLVGVLIIVFIFFIRYRFKSNNIAMLGLERKQNEKKRLTLFNNVYNSFKEILINNKFDFFQKQWENSNNIIYNFLIKYQVRVDRTKSFIEFFSVFIIIIVVLGIVFFSNNANVLVTLAFYIVLLFRIVPSIIKLINASQLLNFNSSSVASIKKFIINKNEFLVHQGVSTISFNSKIELKNISYKYDKKNIIQDFNLIIEKNDFVAIIGPSGSGKSTLIDIILGLRKPQNGTLKIDNTPFDYQNLNSWWCQIGIVSQRVNLLDDSIMNNILLGDKLDIKKFEEALIKASLYDFVYSLEMSHNHQLINNGANISGGQRQRLLIARALYKSPTILIFDEATSALDELTELNLLEEIRNLTNSVTVIFITHNNNVKQFCNKIFSIDSLNN